MKLSRKNKAWMEDCKQLITDLSTTLQAKTIHNQQLIAKINQLQHRLSIQEKDIEESKKLIKILEQQKRNQTKAQLELKSLFDIQRKSLKTQIQNKLKQVENAYKLNDQLHHKLLAKEAEISELQKNMKKTNGFLVAAQSHISFLKSETQTLRTKNMNLQREHQIQLQNIKDLNINIKERFNLIEQDYTSILKLNDEIPSEISPSNLRRNRLSINKHILQQSTEAKPRSKSKRHQIINKQRINPEMGQQLIKIKKAISGQYNRMNETRDRVMKDRVNKALGNIQGILSEMSDKLQADSSSYEF